MSNVQIQVKGMKEVEAKLSKLGKSLESYMQQAASQSAVEILDTEGLRTYPPSTGANQPPTPYYIRGVGMQRAGKRKPEYNDGKSEKLGSQFHVDKVPYGARIANRASYAKHVIGEDQAKHMAAIGWKSLPKFVKEKISDIRKTFDAWVKKAIKDAGL